MPAPKDPEKYKLYVQRQSESHKGQLNLHCKLPKSEEHKQKLKEAMLRAYAEGRKSKINSGSFKKGITPKGSVIFVKGQHTSIKTEFKKGSKPWNKDLPSELQPFWKGGKSFEPYSIEFNDKFKETIRKRDSYVCQLCGKNQKDLSEALHIHHIDYNKLNCNSNNCISLCNSCHGILETLF
jgi:hypothetical protein